MCVNTFKVNSTSLVRPNYQQLSLHSTIINDTLFSIEPAFWATFSHLHQYSTEVLQAVQVKTVDYVVLRLLGVGASWFVGSRRRVFGRGVELCPCIGAAVL